MKHKKSFFIALLILLLVAALLGIFYKKTKQPTQTTSPKVSKTQTSNLTEKDFLIEGYPKDTVPLYKLRKISSAKFFVNKDPKRYEDYFGKSVNYFNIVFETEADANETLEYYRSLMTEQSKDSPSDQVQGVIGKYKVSVSHYGENPQNDAYLQVYLPENEYRPENPYYTNYPKIVELDPTWTEYEASFGLLNQKGGEIEYTQYFPMSKEDIEIEAKVADYKEKYQDKTDYKYDPKTGLMQWKDGEYAVSLTFSKNHGRIYLMIRQPLL